MASDEMQSILRRKKLVQDALDAVQSQLFYLENKYLEDTAPFGNVVKGWEGYIDAKPRDKVSSSRKERRPKPSERIFSYSSTTSPIPGMEDKEAKEPKSLGAGPDGPSAPRGTKKKTNKRKRKEAEDPDFVS